MYDVIVIGGGPSALMAASAASERKKRVLLIDKGDKLGRKLAISGGGRCNVTNRLPMEEIIKHIPGNGKFLYSASAIFKNEDIIRFFENLGVALKEEDHGRMFPVSNDAQSVVQALLRTLHTNNVTIRTNTPVKTIHYTDERVSHVELMNGETIATKSVIVAVGGKSVPQTGSTGDGYPWAKKAGHTITDLFPTEVPITSNAPFIQQKTLQGLALRDCALSVTNHKGKVIKTHRMDMLFTHFGISGPAALRCSQYVVKELKKAKGAVYLTVDVMPDMKQEDLFQLVVHTLKAEPKKAVKNALKLAIPERYLLFLLEQAEIDGTATYSQISADKWRTFISLCKQFAIEVNGTLSIEKAFVTGGGVSVKELDPKTMGSKKMSGLFFCGEILDIHGYTGGYNITSALITGRLAGMNA